MHNLDIHQNFKIFFNDKILGNLKTNYFFFDIMLQSFL